MSFFEVVGEVLRDGQIHAHPALVGVCAEELVDWESVRRQREAHTTEGAEVSGALGVCGRVGEGC